MQLGNKNHKKIYFFVRSLLEMIENNYFLMVFTDLGENKRFHVYSIRNEEKIN